MSISVYEGYHASLIMQIEDVMAVPHALLWGEEMHLRKMWHRLNQRKMLSPRQIALLEKIKRAVDERIRLRKRFDKVAVD